jgi:hypothetical protein
MEGLSEVQHIAILVLCGYNSSLFWRADVDKSRLPDQLLSLKVFSVFQELLLTDSLWTSYLNAAKEIPRGDRRAITSVAARMEKLLSGLPVVLRIAKAIARKNEKNGSEALRQFLSSLSGSARVEAEHATKDLGNLSKTLLVSISTLEQRIKAEQQALARKRKAIAAGKFVAGDLTHEFICGICQIVLVAAVLTQNEFAFHWAAAQAVASGC